MYSEDKFSLFGGFYEVSHGGKVAHFVSAVTACGANALSVDPLVGFYCALYRRTCAWFSIRMIHRHLDLLDLSRYRLTGCVKHIGDHVVNPKTCSTTYVNSWTAIFHRLSFCLALDLRNIKFLWSVLHRNLASLKRRSNFSRRSSMA